MILVGDIEDEHTVHGLDAQRNGSDTASRRKFYFQPREADPGLEVAAMPDSDIICGCNGVRKGDIVRRFMPMASPRWRGSRNVHAPPRSCGTCTGLCEKLLRAVTPDFQEETRTTCAPACRSPTNNCAT